MAIPHRCFVLLLAAVVLVTCRSADPNDASNPPENAEPESSASEPGPASGQSMTAQDPRAPAKETRSFPPPWCDRTGPEGTRIDVINAIGNDYLVETMANCTTRGLTATFTLLQRMLWLGYLIDFTYLLTGCPLALTDEEPVMGGLAEFGIANTKVVGADRAALGPDDAALLISMYVGHFSSALELTPDERVTLEAFLANLAREEVDPSLSRTLSTCAGDMPGTP